MTEASDTPKKPRKKTERLRLNKSNVESLKVPGEYHDDQLLGFIVRVSNDKGVVRRTYKVRAKPKNATKAITYTIGKHGVYTAETAREAASALIYEIKEGRKPKQEKDAEEKLEKEAIEKERIRKDFTLKVAFDGYLEFKDKLAPSTVAQYAHHIHVTLKEWLDKPMVEIDEDMVLAKYRLTCASSISTAKNAFTLLSLIFNWYIKKDKGKTLTTNPVDILGVLKLWVEVKPRREIIEDEKLKTWWREVEQLENPDHAEYLKLLLLTGLRMSELLQMVWEDVDFKKRSWTVRKTKNGLDHSLPFTNYVGSILKHRSDQRGSGVYVFPGRFPDSHMVCPVRSQKKIEQAGVSSCPKVLRTTFCTMAIRLVPEGIAKKFMNHKNERNVTQWHYSVLDDVDLEKELQSVEDRILKLCTAGSEKEKGEA